MILRLIYYKNMIDSNFQKLPLMLHFSASSWKPCHTHNHYGFHIWQNRTCLVICASYSEYGVRTEDVAVVLETFPFKHKGFFLYWKRKFVFLCPFRKSGFQLQPDEHTSKHVSMYMNESMIYRFNHFFVTYDHVQQH